MKAPKYIVLGETRFSVSDFSESAEGTIRFKYQTGFEIGSPVELLDDEGKHLGHGRVVDAIVQLEVRPEEENPK